MSDTDVRIGEVVTDVTIVDGVGSLSPEDVRKIVKLVLDQLQQEQSRQAERERDTTIHDRVFRPSVG